MKLLLAYPAAWRERYGDELASLIEADSGGGRVPWRVKLDVIRAGLAERVRSSGPPEARIRAGVLLVLESWAAFVVAGLAFAKTTEHVAANAAYTGVHVAAGVGMLAVVLGIALVARPLFAFLRAGGWQTIHRPVVRAIGATGLTVVAFVPVVLGAPPDERAAQRQRLALHERVPRRRRVRSCIDRPLDAGRRRDCAPP